MSCISAKVIFAVSSYLPLAPGGDASDADASPSDGDANPNGGDANLNGDGASPNDGHPPHLLRLEPFDLITRCHGWMGIRPIFNWRLRKQRSGLCSRGKRGRTSCKSNSSFVAAI
jgi:hypothetical protein